MLIEDLDVLCCSVFYLFTNHIEWDFIYQCTIAHSASEISNVESRRKICSTNFKSEILHNFKQANRQSQILHNFKQAYNFMCWVAIIICMSTSFSFECIRCPSRAFCQWHTIGLSHSTDSSPLQLMPDSRLGGDEYRLLRHCIDLTKVQTQMDFIVWYINLCYLWRIPFQKCHPKYLKPVEKINS